MIDFTYNSIILTDYKSPKGYNFLTECLPSGWVFFLMISKGSFWKKFLFYGVLFEKTPHTPKNLIKEYIRFKYKNVSLYTREAFCNSIIIV